MLKMMGKKIFTILCTNVLLVLSISNLFIFICGKNKNMVIKEGHGGLKNTLRQISK